MKLYLDTSTPTTILKLDEKTYEWDSGRELAEKLLSFIHEKLQENGKSWQDITEITFMSGPDSFTGESNPAGVGKGCIPVCIPRRSRTSFHGLWKPCLCLCGDGG